MLDHTGRGISKASAWFKSISPRMGMESGGGIGSGELPNEDGVGVC
jgi:hypothetical protein